MTSKVTRVAVIGTTAWGTTLAVMLARRGIEVRLWARTEKEARKLGEDRENQFRLPGVPFSQELRVTSSLEQALDGAELVILAVPAQSMRANVRLARDYLDQSMLVLSAAKGLEVDSARRMSVVVAEEVDPSLPPRISALSGPNLSREIARGLPATTVVAAHEASVAQRVQEIMASPLFRVYTNKDVVGVELGGALKNIVALGAGLADGLGVGDNAKAGLITRGLAEITRLGVAAGANPQTFAGLAGLGDVVATCSSPLSRNRFVGQELAKGRPLAQVVSSLGSVAEGIDTTRAALRMARDLGVEMPVAEMVFRVMFEALDARQAVTGLMERELKEELSGLEL